MKGQQENCRYRMTTILIVWLFMYRSGRIVVVFGRNIFVVVSVKGESGYESF